MQRPTNLKELIEFLTLHPEVIKRHKGLPARESFLGMEGGFMWFMCEDGEKRHIPIECGMAARETGLTFDREGFQVTKFGVTIDFLYADPGETP